MVIMGRQDYISKANMLLNQNTYRSIPWNPTNTLKNKLLNILKSLKVKLVLAIKPIRLCTPQVVSPQVLWPSQDPQARHSSQVYCVQLWVGHIWGGKRTCQNLKTISWQVPPST